MGRPKKVVEQVPERILTDAELFFVTEKSKTMSAEDIAEALKVDVNLVKPHIPTVLAEINKKKRNYLQ